MRMEPLELDLKVRCLFEEDLSMLVFPKVKEFMFRVSRYSPLEVAAKALARKNEHGHMWHEYSFSWLCKRTDQETKLYDLSVRFDSLTIDGDELNLFYRVNKLGQ